MPNRKVHVRRNLENTMLKIGGRLNVCYEQQSLLTIRSMVKTGIGATVMNWPSMSDLWFSGDLDGRRIVNPGLSRTICLAVPNSRPLSAVATAAYGIVRQTMVSEVENGNWKGGRLLETSEKDALAGEQ
jgi:LysR family nitrogen assimilation transcriptional regulator